MASVDELSKKYSSQLSQLHSIFPTWDEGDLVFTLQDAKGNLEEAAMAITEGRASQFTQATRKKPVKTTQTQGKGYSNRNADTGGWENVNGGESAGRGGRGGRGGSRGGRGGRGGEPFRGGRGGRGGARGGRGGLANVNGGAPGKKTNGYPTSTATTTEGWANQVEQATAADGGDDAGWTTAADAVSTVKADAEESGSKSEPPVEASKADDFSAAGGLSDAPAPKEIEAAVKQSAPAPKPKLTWAQIAKPAEKPKPVAPPPPAPKKEPEPPVTTDEPTTEATPAVPQELTEETPAEEPEAFGDAPASEEVEAEAEEVQESYANGEAEEAQPEEPVSEPTQDDAWGVDPAIAGSGAEPSWAKESAPPAEPASAIAPEPVTTYTGPPGFNTVASKAAVANQPRTSSRAGRFKNADGQGVVLPASISGVSAMEMQFGSLSFGGQGGDGVEAPVVEPETPAQSAPAPAQQIVSPVRAAPQPIAAVQPPHVPSSQPAAIPTQSQPAAPPSAQAQPSAPVPSTHPYYSQHQQQQQQQQQPPAAQQQQGGYTAPHQTLQQQMSGAYASQYGQQQQQQPQAQAQDQTQQSFYRGQQDYYSAFGSQGQQQPSQHQQQQQQHQPQQSHQLESAAQQAQQQPSSQAQHQASPYDSGFGGFGASQHVGQPQHQPHQHANDTFGAAQRAYDSYSASGYPRPPVEEPKQAAPAPSHTPTAQAQPQQGLAHQSQYYQQLNNMGYYQAAPYNPYYQYGQAPQPGFQQYYPLATRGGLYGQPNPQAPPAPIPPANKPSPAPAHSPYGGPSPYPSSNYDDQSSLNIGRYGESKPQGATQQPGAQAQSYQSQGAAGGLHNFLGMNTPSATSSATSRPQVATPDDGFKSQNTATSASTTGVGAGVPGQQSRAAPQHNQQGGAGGQQHQGFGGYPYGTAGAGYGNQDWSQYGGQHYGSRNGYSQWQQ